MEPVDDLLEHITDPVDRLLLTGAAGTVREAEEMYLDSVLPEFLELMARRGDDEESDRHPLVRFLINRGGRAWEDSLL